MHLLLAILACSSKGGDASGTHTSGGATSTPGPPTAGSTTGVVVTGDVEATVRSDGVRTCPDPAAREAEPFVALQGGDLADQPIEPGDGLLVADLTGDDLPDILLPGVGPDLLYVQQPGGDFADETATRWSGDPADATMGLVAGDLDGDGDLDVITANDVQPNGVHLNDGAGFFSRLDGAAGGSAWASWGISLGDVDGDGDLDAAVTDHGGGSGTWPGGSAPPGAPPIQDDPNEILLNRGDGRFDVLSEGDLPPEATEGYAFAAALADVDLDLDPDLVVVNDHGTYRPDALLRNDGGTFVDVTEASGTGLAVQGMGLGLADLNGDLVPEMLVTDWGGLPLLESAGDGTWFEASATRGLVPDAERGQEVAWGAAFGDLDNDGLQDLAVAYGTQMGMGDGDDPNPDAQPDAVFLQQPDGSFIDVAPDWSLDDTHVGRGLVLADLDHDGWLDLVRRYLDAPATVHLARCGEAAWIEVALEAPPPNTRAVGARVEVDAGGSTQVRWVRAGGTSLGSAGPPEVHFGLGTADAIDELRITWPDGATTRITGLAPRQRVHVVREAATRASRSALK